MDFVGDYTAKSAEAKRLRALQEAMGKQTWDEGTIKTQATGNFPGQEQVNWGSALGKLGLAYMGRGAEDKAATAETEAQAAQMAAVNDAVAGGGDLTPEKIMQLQQLGIDTNTIKLMKPDKEALGAITQAYGDRNQLRGLLDIGKITKEQYDSALAEMDANEAAAEKRRREGEAYDQSVKRFAPTGGGSLSDFEVYQQLGPEEYAKFKAAGKAPTGGGTGDKEGRYNAAREAEVLLDVGKKMQALIDNDKDGSLFGVQAGAGQLLKKAGQESTDKGLVSNAYEWAGGKVLPSDAGAMDRLGTEAALESVAKLSPASDADIRLLKQQYPNPYMNKQTAQEYINRIIEIATRHGGGTTGVIAPAAEEEWGIVE